MGLLDGAAIGAGADAFMDAYGLSRGIQQRDKRIAQQDQYQRQMMDYRQQLMKQQQDQIQRQQMIEDRKREANAMLLGGGLLGDAGPNGRTPGEMSTKYGGYNPLEYVNPNTVAAMQPEPVKWETKQVGDKVVAYNPYTQETKPIGDAPAKDNKPSYDMFVKPGGGLAYLPKGSEVPERWKPYEKPSGKEGGGYSYDKLISDIETLDGKIASLKAGVGIAADVTAPQRQEAINDLLAKRSQMFSVARGLADKGGFTFPYADTAQGGGKQWTTDKAREFLEQANGDKAKARKMAAEQGYVF